MSLLERAILTLGLHGVTITAQVEGLSLDSPRLYVFYTKVVELDVPIYVHPALFPERATPMSEIMIWAASWDENWIFVLRLPASLPAEYWIASPVSSL